MLDPHGIRWSKLTKKVYSIQEGYGQIVEIDPNDYSAITNTFDLTGLPYTAFGITPDGRFLLLARSDTHGPRNRHQAWGYRSQRYSSGTSA